MSAAQDSSNIRLPLEKKASVTEDLHVNISEQSRNKENILDRQKLEDIKEDKNVTLSKDTSKPITPVTSVTFPKNKKVSADKSETQKTLAEITQEMKGELNKIIQEINNSDTEFERIMGNIEQQIADLRLKIGSSASK